MKIMLGSNPFNKIKFYLVFILVFSLLTCMSIWILSRFKPVFEEKASHAAKTKALDIINKSTDSTFSDNLVSELAIIEKDESGRITAISANTLEINRIKTALSKKIHQLAENNHNSTVYIPIGSLTNISVLQGFGYRIPIKILTDGIAKIDFENEFKSVGINQVKHKIFMTVSVRVSVISSTFTKTETVTSEIPVYETIISGTVPTYYGDNMSILGR